MSTGRHRAPKNSIASKHSTKVALLGVAGLIIASPAITSHSAQAAGTALSAVPTTSVRVAQAVHVTAPTQAQLARSPYAFGTVNYNRWYAKRLMAAKYHWGSRQFQCLAALWTRESGWSQHSYNRGSGATGIPQAVPGWKMASAGPNWRTDPRTQIRWGLRYIRGTYGTPCGAWSFSQWHGWY